MSPKRLVPVGYALAAAALCGWLAWQEGAPAHDVTPAGAHDGEGSAPGLIGARRAPGDRPLAPQAPPAPLAEEARARVRQAPRRFFFGPRAEDDAALPFARTPLDVLVVDRQGRPVPRAQLVGRWGRWHTRTYSADERGHVRMSVPPNIHGLEVHGQVGPSTGSYCFVHYHPLEPGASTTRVVVRRWVAISGRVRSGGESFTNGRVHALRLPDAGTRDPDTADLYLRPRSAGTAALASDGTFTLEVPDDAPVTLLCWGDVGGERVHGLARVDVSEPRTPALAVEPSTRRSSLRLRVLRPDGHPAAGARIRLALADGTADCGLAPPEPTRVEVTDGQGRVTIGGLATWVYRIGVEARPGPYGWAAHATFCHAGDEVELRLWPRPDVLQGRVLDRTGAPVGGARVEVFVRCAPRAQMETDVEGRFRCAPAPRGTRVQAVALDSLARPTARGYADAVEVGGGPVTLVLQRLDSPAGR